MGKVSLRDLLLADTEALLGDLARPQPHVARPLDNERDVARLIADDDLFALPVVDETACCSAS